MGAGMSGFAVGLGGDDGAPLPDFSPELRFVFATARLASGGVASVQLDRAAAQVGDWDIVQRGLVHHGLIGLAVPALVRAGVMSVTTCAALEAPRRAHVVGAMQRLHELVRIARALEAAGIRYVFIKGIALSIQLYGDPVARGGRDIDVLVERKRTHDAEAILRDLGYVPPIHASPARPDEDTPPKESGWVHGESRILVELHDRLCENPALLPWDFEALWAERETVTIAGMAVPAMARRRLPIYLAVHGIRHGWQRLMWLADLAMLLDSDAAWDETLATAAKEGLEGMMLHVGWALHHWLARPVPAAVLARSTRRIDVRLLNRLVAQFHDGPQWYEARPRNSLRRFIAGSVWSRSITYAIKPTWHFWGRQLAWDLSSSQDRAAFALPGELRWMYPLIRPFGWAIRRLRA